MKHVAALSAGVIALLFLSGTAFSKPDKGDSSDPVFPPGGSKHVSEWIKDLRSSDDLATRKKALLVLKATSGKYPGVVLGVCGAMKQDKDIDIRVDAAIALGLFAPRPPASDKTIDTHEMVDSLQTVLAGENKDPEERVREAAAISMGKMGDDAQITGLTALIEALKDKPKVQTAAAASIDALATPNPRDDYKGIVADDAGQPMLTLLKDSSAPMLARCSAALFISKLKSCDGRITALIDTLAEEKNEPLLRKTAADMLGARFKDLAVDGVPAMIKALTDKNDELRIAAGTALAQVALTGAGKNAIKGSLPDICKALKDGNATVRNRAMNILANLEGDAVDAIKDLITCLQTEKVTENRVAAIRALGLIGPPAKDAIELISTYTSNANPEVRNAATKALERIKGS